MRKTRRSRVAPTAISGVALAVALIGSSMLGGLGVSWWMAFGFAFVVLTGGLVLELRRAKRGGSASAEPL